MKKLEITNRTFGGKKKIKIGKLLFDPQNLDIGDFKSI